MPFVQRDGSGNITGVYACPQPGYAEEEMIESHAEIVAFRNPPDPPENRDPLAELDALKVALVTKLVLTEEEAG